MKTVGSYMTKHPHSIGVTQKMAAAHRLMREHGIRHLPVLDAGQLVGIVTERDLHLIETLHDVDPEKVRVEEAMTTDPYTVGPDAPIDEVVNTMADCRYGSALVMEGDKVVGIFTTIDALHALREFAGIRKKH